MEKKFLLLLAIATNSYGMPPNITVQPEIHLNSGSFGIIDHVTSLFKPELKPLKSLSEIKVMMQRQSPKLSAVVIDKVMAALTCANDQNVDHNHILTVIDYSLPSNQKRLWVFDLSENKLLFNTYVSHGIKSGSLLTNFFSNKYNSKATSLGIYKAKQSYYGREGLSLRLGGLDRSFNDNADGRSIVMHGGWYVDEKFIKNYGRPGRSWGCPALPPNLAESIINTIKDNSMIVAYYPSDDWFVKSKFLNCNPTATPKPKPETQQNAMAMMTSPTDELRGDILYVDSNRNSKHEESDPVLVISADNYKRFFQTNAPLERMLRRQINHVEFIALTKDEYSRIIASNNPSNQIYFVIPTIKMKRGYYETEMKIVNYGKIRSAKPNDANSTTTPAYSYSVSFETRPSINLKSTNQFIRWVGL